ncbi:MAG: histidine kinase [Bacteroidota bacterium]
MTSLKYHLSILLPGFVSGMLVYMYMLYQESSEEETFVSLHTMMAGLCGILNAYLIHGTSLWLNRQISWQKHPGSRLLTGLLLNGCLAFGMSSMLFWAYTSLFVESDFQLRDHPQTMLKLGLILLILVLVYSVVYFAVYSFHQYSKGQIEVIHLERQRLGFQLQALKSQLGPHFLFNGLNTIANLVIGDPDKAEVFVRQLARLYQYTLANYRKEWVSISEELAFVDAYLFLLTTRFDKMLEVSIDVPDEAGQMKIPPMTLQMLVENATKHNQMSEENPLQITIGADNHQIWVSNTINKKPQTQDSFRIGLENIRRRYQLQSHLDIDIQKGRVFTIKLPLIAS